MPAIKKKNIHKIILDLCGGTGAWSRPYKEAGYDVRVITLPQYNVITYKPPKNTYGILAAPVCTDFTSSCSWCWDMKDMDGRTLNSTKVLTGCLHIIAMCENLKFWALEQPVGRTKEWLGDPVYTFNPCDFGDPYTKLTLLWGLFNEPLKTPVEPILKNYIRDLSPSKNRQTIRSITPPGFTKAFFQANR